jgi:hypothetical protein
MKITSTRVATALFFLWGVVHVLGGGAMLVAAQDPQAYLAMVATGRVAASAVTAPGDPAVAVFAFHAWNIVWAGLMVSVIAIVLNGRNSRAGYWVNMAIVSGADIGLLLFLVVPGVMSPATAIPGLALWLPAGLAGWLSVRSSPPVRRVLASQRA